MIKKTASSLLLLFLLSLQLHGDVCRAYTAGNGYARYLPTTAKLLTDTPTAGVALPSGVQGAVIFVNVAPIRFRTDGVPPTSSEGAQVPAGTTLIFNVDTISQLSTFQFIQVSAGAEVTINYCGGKK